jgi:DNA ligase-1
MLADDADLAKLRFPLLASPKLDGVRAIVIDGVVMSRSLKPIPSQYVQEQFSHLEHFDGELIVGDPTAKDCYRKTMSAVMSRDKRDFDVTFFAFDHIAEPSDPYSARADRLYDDLLGYEGTPTGGPVCKRLNQSFVESYDELLAHESQALEDGFEGLILRDAQAPYKFGRSTTKQGYLLKLKRFIDSEATVIGFEERMHNGNEATTDELGHTKRSSHAANKSGLGDLGALLVRHGDVEFSIGTGFDAETRREIWDNRVHYVGQLAKFKYFPVGVKDKPRHPVFLGWRDRIDI